MKRFAPTSFATAGLAAIVAFLLLPRGGLAQACAFLGLAAAAALLLARATWRMRARDRLPWRILVAGELVYLSANLTWYLAPVAFDHALPYPSAVDGAFFVAYALFGVGLLLLLSRNAPLKARIASSLTLDGLVVLAATGAVIQATLVGPIANQPGLPLSALAVSIAYPVTMTLVLGIALQLLLRGVLRSRPGILLILWIGMEMAADFWYSAASLEGTFEFGHPGFTLWMLSYIALGMAALTPGLARVGHFEEREAVDPKRNFALLAVAAVVSLAALTVSHVHDPGLLLAQVGWLALTLVLVLSRLWGLLRDVDAERSLRTQVERFAATLEEKATLDMLTGALNRFGFERAHGQALARCARGRPSVLILADLDGFKSVNDRFGHAAGDAVLVEVARRCTLVARRSDAVARLGGDEFAVIAENASPPEGLALAERLAAAIREPIVLPEGRALVGASLGVYALAPDDDFAGSMRRADAAMYAAKSAGGGALPFDREFHAGHIARHQLVAELRTACAERQFVLHYQPVVELESRRTVAVEALIRWQHPARGLLGPAAFIDLAEESGLIAEAGRWVLRQACCDAARWNSPGGGGERLGVAVNVSQRQLQSPSIVDDIAAVISDTGLDPSLLSIEVTETAVMSDSGELASRLHAIKALGVDIAMDDFGTGYSSLAQLRALPIDVLKIDRAFVSGIAVENEEWALAMTITRLATSLGKRIVAEGVEHPSQLAHLRALGCRLGQGYLFARPMPAEELELQTGIAAVGDARAPELGYR